MRASSSLPALAPQRGRAVATASEESIATPTRVDRDGRDVPKKQKSKRLNHLGQILDTKRNKFRYARSFTILSDPRGERRAGSMWSLVSDTRKAVDCSMPRLRVALQLFSDALETGQTLIGPRAFKLALNQLGLRDNVLIDRLFGSFAEPHGGVRVDYREFLREFACVAMRADLTLD